MIRAKTLIFSTTNPMPSGGHFSIMEMSSQLQSRYKVPSDATGKNMPKWVYTYIYIHIYYITTIHLGENVFLHGHAGLWKKCAECCSVLFAGAGERNVAWHCSNGLDDPNGLA
jgi:hypothetical protein